MENYFKNEIEKYDIWQWGGTRIFKPLEIVITRQNSYINNEGEIVPNSAFPMGDKKRLDIIEIEYSDKDLSKLEFLWNADDIGDNKKGKIIHETSNNFTEWRKGA